MNFKRILAIGLFLLALSLSLPRKSFHKKFFLSQKKAKILYPERVLQRAYLFGEKKMLSPKQRNAHRHLGLLHLMTPSGLHLASLTFILFLFIKRKKRQFLFLLGLGLFSFNFDHIDSFQRMILFSLLKGNPWRKMGASQAFCLTFILCSFQYFQNPLSYTFSFFFLGILLCPLPNLMKPPLLLLCQFFISNWLEQSFYPLGSLYGLFLSSLSLLTFPLIGIEYLFGFHSFTRLWSLLLQFFDHIKGPSLQIPLATLLPFIFIGKKLKPLALGLSLLLMSSPLGGKIRNQFGGYPPRGYEELKKLHNGFKTTYKSGLRCFSRLREDQWITHCYH